LQWNTLRGHLERWRGGVALSVNALTENFSNGDRLWVQAATGGLTWGQFSQGRKDLATRSEEILNQANFQLQQQRQAELAQQQLARAATVAQMQRALQNAGNAYGNMQIPQQRTINCNTTYGSGTSSTTCY
jgi:hypothetical protein